MTKHNTIFIFTKDRPKTLEKTLRSIDSTTYDKYVIDDSVKHTNQKKVIELCKFHSNCNYLGKAEFNQFITTHKIEFPQFDFLLRELGCLEWNLGYARNFALLYSKAIKAEKVLFMDDDIEVQDLNLIELLFKEANNYRFVGAHIMGLVDDSALGHIATGISILNERMLSGGFMVFKPKEVDQYFLNNYNEDWIWLFLQLQTANYLQTGEVDQELTDPLLNYEGKVLFQEFGEIALDGILDINKVSSLDTLIELSFWERIIQERKEYLSLLKHKSVAVSNTKYLEIIDWLKSNSENFNAAQFQQLFENYFVNRKNFLALYNLL